jgi:hypothetical protein
METKWQLFFSHQPHLLVTIATIVMQRFKTLLIIMSPTMPVIWVKTRQASMKLSPFLYILDDNEFWNNEENSRRDEVLTCELGGTTNNTGGNNNFWDQEQDDDAADKFIEDV